MFGKKTTTKEKVADTKEAVSKGLVLSGIVVSAKMKDTIVVKVNRFVKVPKYERFMKISKKYKAHDAGNTKKEGETVQIVETKPISKDKHFKVLA
jgi:small subunit ribosomal protein S17